MSLQVELRVKVERNLNFQSAMPCIEVNRRSNLTRSLPFCILVGPWPGPLRETLLLRYQGAGCIYVAQSNRNLFASDSRLYYITVFKILQDQRNREEEDSMPHIIWKNCNWFFCLLWLEMCDPHVRHLCIVSRNHVDGTSDGNCPHTENLDIGAEVMNLRPGLDAHLFELVPYHYYPRWKWRQFIYSINISTFFETSTQK